MKRWMEGTKQDYFSRNPRNWSYCGICSVFFVLRTIGFKVRPEEIVKDISKWRSKDELKNGVTVGDIKKVLKLYNINSIRIKFVRAERKDFFELLKDVASFKTPIIVFPFGHAITVIGVKGNNVYYIEPDNLNEFISVQTKSEFFRYCFGPFGLAEALPLLR